MSTKYLKLSAITSVLVATLSACGGSSDSNSTPAPVDQAPVARSVSVTDAQQWSPITVDMGVSDPDGDILTFTFTENDETVAPVNGVYTFTHGKLTLRPQLGEGTYTSFTGQNATISYQVTANGQSASGSISISNVQSDPLAYQQWHLRNTAQRAFSMSDSAKTFYRELYASFGLSEEAIEERIAARFDESVLVAGEDMNVLEAYAQGAMGKGATAVVVDSGLEIAHEDLAANVLAGRSLNFIDGAADPTNPTSTGTGGDHGTSVGGLIAAVAGNGKGGRGVAPEANLIGMNYLEVQNDLNNALAHGFPGSGITTSENVAVFNRSYGISLPTFIGFSEISETVESYPSLNLRDKKGTINVKSSGNSFDDAGNSNAGNICDDNGAIDLGLTCLNGGFEPSQSTPYYLAVAAVNSDGMHTSYSTAGANVFVSAPAGEFGTDAPAMVTTDKMTCLRGYSSFPSRQSFDDRVPAVEDAFAKLFPFNSGEHPENPSCNYTSTFNGTSSAAPNASGVISLMLAANPNLTWRDVRYILAKTSTKVDPDRAAVTIDVNGTDFVARDAWITNAAGFNFNNLYGFGRVDAGAAVEMATSFNVDLGTFAETEWLNNGEDLSLAIPDNNANGVTHTIEVTEEMDIESMQFMFDIANPELVPVAAAQTTAGMDLAIEVTSPSGTRSMLLSSKQAITLPALTNDFFFNSGYILNDSVMISNAFYGESAVGTWTFRFVDVSNSDVTTTGAAGGIWANNFANNTVPSVVENVRLRVYGH